MRLPLALLLTLLLSGCGYHLVGSGNGPITSDTIVVEADTPLGEQAKTMLIRQLAEEPRLTVVADAPAPHATLHIQHLTEAWSTQGFDASGIANRYQMVLRGSLWLEPSSDSKADGWRSGTITRKEELFASGGPVAIEANRSQLRRQLLTRWVTTAINRLRSGF